MYFNCHTSFSLNYGIMSVKELLAEAERHGVKELVLTDINNTSGCIDFMRLAPKHGIKTYIGVDFRIGNVQQYIAIAHSLNGYKNICDFLSDLRINKKPVPNTAPPLEECTVIYPWIKGKKISLRDNEYLGIQPKQTKAFNAFATMAERKRAVPLATVTFRNKEDYNCHRLLRAIGLNTLLSMLPKEEHGSENDGFIIDIESCYEHIPQAVENVRHIFSKGTVDFSFGIPKNKLVYGTSLTEDFELLKKLAEDGFEKKYPTPSSQMTERLEKELAMIAGLDFTAYFLINWDIVEYAKRNGFFHTGRGSGANSIVAYCIGITCVDPIELDLYFERFINPSRKNPPDFDIDFSHTDRDIIRQYIFDRYPGHTALVGSYNTFERRSCIRELGKVFGLPDKDIDNLQSMNLDINNVDHIGTLVLKYASKIHGLPNLLSVHACGVLISNEPITTYGALELMPVGFVSTQFSMLEAEDVGLNKYDILSQRGLGHIRDAVTFIKENKGIDVDIFDVEKFKVDPIINDLLTRGDTIGCFYVESPAMRQLLRKLLVTDYLGLVAASSVIRPGVASSGMMRAFIERYRFPERRADAHPRLLEIMPDTFGVMVYQEDVIKVAHHYAGLTLEESDVMRRGMSGKFRSREEFIRVKERFFANCKSKGYPDDDAAEVWRQIESFAGYSFAKGHSASYAVESYQSLFLRAYYPVEFMTAVVNNFGGFYSTEFYLHEARMLGAIVELPCVNKSDILCVLTGNIIYMGLCLIKDLENKTVTALLQERKRNGIYAGLHDFVKRVTITLDQLRILINIKAFRFTDVRSMDLLWQAHEYFNNTKRSIPARELFAAPPVPTELPELDPIPYGDALNEKQILGFYHTSPFSLIKRSYSGTIYANELIKHVGNTVYIQGYFVADKLVNTVHGENMFFGTFIDSKGKLFDTVHFPQSLEHSQFKGRGVYLIKGKVVTDLDVPSIEVSHMEMMDWVF